MKLGAGAKKESHISKGTEEKRKKGGKKRGTLLRKGEQEGERRETRKGENRGTGAKCEDENNR